MPELPTTTRALVLHKRDAVDGKVYHGAEVEDRPIPALQQGQVLVRVAAVGFNRRDYWQRLGMYPGMKFDQVMGSDAAGVVIAAHDASDPLINKHVFLTTHREWESGPAPTTPHGMPVILGAGGSTPEGTFAEYVVVDRHEVLETPAHLDDVHAAAWPLAATTAWRALVTHAQVGAGENVLVTGIGGGVALLAAQLAIARGANVFVTSGTQEKIERAKELGVKGGVVYRSAEWPAELAKLLKGTGRPYLDAVIDSAGGEIMAQVNKVLKAGGKVVVYGMTATPKITFTMREVLKNHQLIGTTMGSRQDLVEATAFMAEHKITPLVDRVLEGLGAAEEGFNLMKNGEQFGKIVIRVGSAEKANL